jgi:hypothetical protein
MYSRAKIKKRSWKEMQQVVVEKGIKKLALERV